MIFTQKQIDSLLEIIDFNTSLFISSQLGQNVLSTYDMYILNKFGFDVKKILTKYPPFLQSYMWGQLTGWLSNNQASKVVYSDFKSYLDSGKHIPMTKKESNMYDIASRRSYSHIKNLGNKRKSELAHLITEEDIKKEMSGAIKRRESIQSIISNWGHKTDNWQRDYGRIADTEMNSIFQLGRAMAYEERFGKDSKVFKDTYPGACRHCIRLHLKSGIGSEPIVLPLEQVIANGSNIGRKVADWKFTIESEHPFCRCTLNHKPEGTEWDSEKKMFVYKEKYERKIERKSKIKISVGTKHFEV